LSILVHGCRALVLNDLQLCRLAKESYARADISVGGIQAIRQGSVLAIRGTEFDFSKIIRNMRAIPWWAYQIGWTHSGFLKGARLINDQCDGVDTYIGHSLGGAIASFLAMFAVLRGETPLLVTWGCPGIGWGGVDDVLSNIEQRNYVNGEDIVHEVPKLYRRRPHVIPIGTPNKKIVKGPFIDHKINNYLRAMY